MQLTESVPNSAQPSRFLDRTGLCSINESLEHIPVCRPLDHTMSLALDQYVCQKLPTRDLLEAIALGCPIELHGLPPGHLEAAPEEFGISHYSRIPWEYASTVKEFNNIRPVFFRVQRDQDPAIFVVVPFGQDYVRHYATLIRHFISMNTAHYHGHISVTRYPRIETDMADITGLNGLVIRSGETIVLGYASELQDALRCRYGEPESFHRNRYYTSQRHRIGKRIVNFLGVKYSYWGSIAKNLVTRICELGGKEVIYSAKLGTLGSQDEIYDRVFSPSSYYIFDHFLLKNSIQDLRNPFLAHFPALDSGPHASVPTVLEETFVQRSILEKYRIQTIDNEIAQMADAITRYNRANDARVVFFALHFATDYLRRNHEKLGDITHDLSRNRTGVATRQKQVVIEKIATLLGDFLEAT